MDKQHGFTAVEVLVAVVAIAILGGAGYLYFNRPANPTPTQANVAVPVKVQSPADLNTVDTVLTDTNIDSSLDKDLGDLDKQLATF